MKKLVALILLLLPIFIYCSNVNGNAFLDNDSDHSDIVIKFFPVSGSAVYSEGFTNSSGVFNISVVNGVYNISYEKSGYQTYVLNDQFISTDMTLPDVTLNSNLIVYVSGNVSGNWTSSNTYIVTGNITVPVGQTLTIEPNTEIKFDGYFSLIVNGTLNAVGTENNYIIFTSTSSIPTNTDWNQIFINTSSTGSILKYCIIEYGKQDNNDNYGIVHIRGELDIENCIIQNSEESAISVRDAGVVNIIGNQIKNCSYGIYVNSSSETTIENNKISNINLIGMSIHLASNSTTVFSNQVSNCGIYGIQSWANIPIKRNIVFEIGSILGHYGIMIPGGQPSIWNNTLFSNAGGIGIYDNDIFNPNPSINSNIIINSSYYAIRSEGEPMPSIVAFNLFHNNGSGIGNNLPVGVGTIITQNENGTESDTYYNIFIEPNLVTIDPTNIEFCELASSSVAINAGDPTISNQFNSTIIDIGAKEFDDNLSVEDFNLNNKILVFPNPVSDFITLKSDNHLFNSVLIFDIKGKLLRAINKSSKVKEMSISELSFLSHGIYMMEVFNDNKMITQIKIIKK